MANFQVQAVSFREGTPPSPPKKTVSSSGYTLRDNHIPQVSVVLVLFPRSPREIECNKKPPRVTEDGNWHNEMERKIFERKHKPEESPKTMFLCKMIVSKPSHSGMFVEVPGITLGVTYCKKQYINNILP